MRQNSRQNDILLLFRLEKVKLRKYNEKSIKIRMEKYSLKKSKEALL